MSTGPNSKSFGEVLKKFREDKGLSQIELAVELDKNRSTITKWEANKFFPDSAEFEIVARFLELSTEELVASVEEGRRRRRTELNGSVLGNYELFQWSYVYDRNVMKTNLIVSHGPKGLAFEEHVKFAEQKGVIRGTVSIVLQNMFLSGRSQGYFKECEVIIVSVPRDVDSWLTGIVAGVSSDAANCPSASRIVLHYLGPKEFTSEPQYLPIKRIGLPLEQKRFLEECPEDWHPILSSRAKEDTLRLKR